MVSELLGNYMREHNLSKKAFCKMCKISLPTLNKILNGERTVRIAPLYKISFITKIPLTILHNNLIAKLN